MIPPNRITKTSRSQESSPICQRGDCTQQASRRVTLETQKFEPPVTLYGVTFMTIINRLCFPERRITVDLCSACYIWHIDCDKTLQIISVALIGSYAEGSVTC